MTILDERQMEGMNLSIAMHLHDSKITVTVSNEDGNPVHAWNDLPDGKAALDVFHHPFAYGLELQPTVPEWS